MLKFNVANQKADNEVVINGTSFGFLTDADTEKLIGIIRGFQSGTPNSTESKPVKATKKRKLKVGYHISVFNDLYCISRGELVDGKIKNAGWTKGEKAMINGAIKALPEIVTTRVKGEREFTAWGYADEATAVKMMATLPTEFEVEA